jgi:hypothetical protein
VMVSIVKGGPEMLIQFASLTVVAG